MTLGAAVLTGLLTFTSALALRAAAVTGRRSLVTCRLGASTPAPRRAVAATAWLPPPPAWLGSRLAAAGVAWDPFAAWSAWLLVGAAATGLAGLAGGPGLAVVAAAAVVAGPPTVLFACSGRAERQLEEALPELLEAVARSLRSGASLRQAMDEAAATPGPLGHDLRSLSCEVAAGVPLTVALDGWGRRRPLPGVRLTVSALALGAETGGAHAQALDGVAATVRARSAVAREVRALSAQARCSAVVIVLAPLGFSALAAATDERTAGFLLGTPLGLAFLAGGLVLDALAALWMHRLSRVDQ